MIMIDTSPAARSALRERNWQALEQFYPLLARWLHERATLSSRLVIGDDGALNIGLGHTELYEPDAQRFTETQVAAFLARPMTFNVKMPAYPPPSPYINQYHLRKMMDWLAQHDIQFDDRVPVDNYGTLVVFGLGLGLHLEPLLDQLRFRNLALVDQTPEFMIHSLDCVNWWRVIERLHANQGRLSFFFDEAPERLAHDLYWDLRGKGNALIDGSYVYRHYQSFVLDEAHRDFSERMPTLCHSAGFIEDEVVMISHCARNLQKHTAKLLLPRPRRQKSTPVFIIGSGPSIDTALETIKKWRDHAIIISSGTGLRVMLANGITPDFHCELENVSTSWHNATESQERFGLDGIKLIASTTVYPDTPDLFAEVIFYFREVLSSTYLFAKPGEEMVGTAPTCTNLSVRAAIALGFHELYLFGLDYGARDPAHHHSRSTVYLAVDGYQYSQEPMSIAIDGNFGGTIHTNATLIWSKQMMSTLLTAHGSTTSYNCSDGAKILATTPLLPENIRLTNKPAQRQQELAQIQRELDFIRAGQLLHRAPLPETIAYFNQCLARMITSVNQSLAARERFVALHDRLMALLPAAETSTMAAVTYTLIDGTLTLILQFGHYVERRLSEDLRPEFNQLFARELLVALEQIQEKGDAVLNHALSLTQETLTQETLALDKG